MSFCGQVSDTEQRYNRRSNVSSHDSLDSLAAIRTDEQLKESVTQHFSKWGTLLDVKVFRDSQQRPYSFVQFEVGHNVLGYVVWIYSSLLIE
jgi:hypothetical protein